MVYATAFGKGLDVITSQQRKTAIAWLERADAKGHREARDYLTKDIYNPAPARE